MITAKEAKKRSDNYFSDELIRQAVKEIGDDIEDATNAGGYFIVYNFTEKNPNGWAHSKIEDKLRELGYITNVTKCGSDRKPVWVFEISWKPIDVSYTSAFDDFF